MSRIDARQDRTGTAGSTDTLAAGSSAVHPAGAPVLPRPARGPVGSWAADLGWRIALTVVAAALAVVGAPSWLAATATGLATVAVVERLVRHRRRGMLDAALVGIGTLVVALGLVGLLLNYLPGGITRTGWAVAFALLAIAALTVAGLRQDETPPSPFRKLLTRAAVPTALFAVAAGGVLAAALVLAVHSYDDTHIPPVDMSSSAVQNGFATVTVAAGTDAGPFEIDLVSGTNRVAVATGITVSARTSTAVVVAVPAGLRVSVQLVKPGTTTALRELMLDTTTSTATTAGAGG